MFDRVTAPLLFSFRFVQNPIETEERTFDNEVAQVVSFGITAATALATWWKNNSFTKAAVMADGVMQDLHKLKCAGKECTCVMVERKVKGAEEMTAGGVG